MLIRKLRAGTDSFGNTWDNDGDVIDIDPEQAAHLIAIPDGGFELVEDHEGRAQSGPVHDDAGKGLPDGVEAGHGARQAADKPENGEGDGRPVPATDTPVVAGDGSGRRARAARGPKDTGKDEANTANEGKDQGVPAQDKQPGK